MSLFESASLVVTPNGTKASKLYAIKPTSGAGDLTVVRATTATRVNSAGLIESVAVNVPRLDYTNSTCPSLLVEPQRTNLVTYSEQFDNSAWTLAGLNATVTANNVISPDGTQNADRVVFGLNGYLYQQKAITGWSSATLSIYSKTTTQKIVFGGATPAGTDTYSSINVGNGWFRQILTRTFTSGGTGGVQVLPFGSNETLYFWGAQLEQGSYPTSYIPTVASSVTRNADVISKTGISSLIGQTEGTLFLDTNINNISSQTNEPVLIYIRGVAEAYIEITPAGRVYGVFYNGTTSTGFINANIGLQNGRHKFAFGYKDNDFTLFLDGVQIGTDTSGLVSGSLTEFGLQYNQNFYVGTQAINASGLWKTRLTNAELAELTTL